MDDSTNTCHREDFAAITERAKSEETIHRASLEILCRTSMGFTTPIRQTIQDKSPNVCYDQV